MYAGRWRLKEHDDWWQCLANLVTISLWWQPVNWLVRESRRQTAKEIADSISIDNIKKMNHWLPAWCELAANYHRPSGRVHYQSLEQEFVHNSASAWNDF